MSSSVKPIRVEVTNGEEQEKVTEDKDTGQKIIIVRSPRTRWVIQDVCNRFNKIKQ